MNIKHIYSLTSRILLPVVSTIKCIPESFFIIKIVAHNDLGEANVAAEEFIGYSGEDVPTEPPTSLEVNEIIGPRSAVLSWKSVRPESVRGDFKGILFTNYVCNLLQYCLRIFFASEISPISARLHTCDFIFTQ